MAYQVWTYEGEPLLIMNKRDLPKQYTTIPPYEGIYEPFHFDEDNQQWVSDYNYEDSKNKDDNKDVDEEVSDMITDDNHQKNENIEEELKINDLIIAELTLTIAEANSVIEQQKNLIDEQSKLIGDSYLDLSTYINKKDEEV